MPDFDKDRIIKLVSQLLMAKRRLDHLKGLSKEDFLSDPDKIGSAKYNFIIAIEACIDMCNHIISRNGYRAPEDYADTFKVMEEVGAFEKACVEDLRNMVKFRNRLVHLYWEVDDNQVYKIMHKKVKEFRKFLNSVSRFLNFQELMNQKE